MRLLENTATGGGLGKAGDSDEDTMPLIPDLDDVQDEDMQLQVSIMNKSALDNNSRVQFVKSHLSS